MSNDPIARLAAHNPVREDDPAVAELIRAGAPEGGRAPEHAANRRRRVAAVAGAFAFATAAVLLVAPALGIGIGVIDFSAAEKAPEPVVREFASLSEGAPPGMDPNVIAGETRKVTTRGSHTLWVAPTKDGGLCLLWTNFSGGCDRLGTIPLSVTWAGAPGFRPGAAESRRFEAVNGFVRSRSADTVEIRLSDGTRVRPEIIWVSPPIGAGFFLYKAPEGVFVEAVTALRDGEPVEEDTGPPTGPERVPPRFARVEKRRLAVERDTSAGTAKIWVAPSKTNGRCAWLELAGQLRLVSPCMPEGYVQGFSFRYERVAGIDLLLGRAAPEYAAFELVDEAGSRVVIHPSDGFLLHEVAAREGTIVRVVGRDGETITRFPLHRTDQRR